MTIVLLFDREVKRKWLDGHLMRQTACSFYDLVFGLCSAGPLENLIPAFALDRIQAATISHAANAAFLMLPHRYARGCDVVFFQVKHIYIYI